MQLTSQESALFSQIKTVRLLVTLSQPPQGSPPPAGPGETFPANLVPERINHAITVIDQRYQFPSSGILGKGGSTAGSGPTLRTFYQMLDETITVADATSILRQDALELTGVPLGQVKAQKQWSGESACFPYLSSVRKKGRTRERERKKKSTRFF